MSLLQNHFSQLPKCCKEKKPDKQGRNSSGELAGREAQGWGSGTAVNLQDCGIKKSECGKDTSENPPSSCPVCRQSAALGLSTTTKTFNDFATISLRTGVIQTVS